MSKNLTIGGIVLALVLSLSSLIFGGTNTVETIREVAVGVAAGTDHYNRESFRNGLTQGGRLATTTTASTYTVTAKDFAGTPTYIDVLPNLSLTLTLNATSTHEYTPNIGDVATTYWRNASSTAGTTITFAAEDAGLDLQIASTTPASLVLYGLDWAKLTFIRESANLTSVLLEQFLEAD